MTTHTGSPEPSSTTGDAVSSAVGDLRDAPMSTLIEGRSTEAEAVIGRVLDLEGSGLLTVASFNASI
ncbi:MAG TPA: hypothetical protein VGG83_10705 [Trebonia sp.]|jgi:hypothetical protein